MTLSAEQIARRRSGITATDVAALSGAHPYRGPINVWMEKMGNAPVVEENDRMRWGNILEPVIRNDYAQRRKVNVIEPGTLIHSCVTWAMATPDGIVMEGHVPTKGLEIKTHNARIGQQYGAPMTDEIPPYVLVQCAWNMYVSGLARWDVVAFFDNQPHDFVVVRDEELIEQLADVAERFLVDHVHKKVAPDPDGSAHYSRYLAQRFPQNISGLVDVDEDEPVKALIEEVSRRRREVARHEASLERAEQILKTLIGEKEGLEWTVVGADGKKKKERITWKAGRERTVVNWSAVAEELFRVVADEKLTGEIVGRYTTVSPGARVFRVPSSWGKES